MAKYLDESGVRTLWSKIKAKLSNKVDASGTVAKSNGVTDYGDRSRTIEIGFAGAGLSTTQYFAVYDATGQKIKDLNVANAKNVLGIYDKANISEVYTKSDLTFVLNGTTLTITKK